MFPWTDSAYADMVQGKILDGNEFETIKSLTDPIQRANYLYGAIATRDAEIVLKLITLLKEKEYQKHKTLEAELRQLYDKSVELYFRP